MIYSKTRNIDGTYGPTLKDRYYLPKTDHGKSSINGKKHKWCINENMEYSVFEIAESPKQELFCKENECYFSIVDNARFVLGTANERIAKFPKPQNSGDPWHGYPVLCDQVYNFPSDELLDLMVDKSIIDKTTRRRIERRKL